MAEIRPGVGVSGPTIGIYWAGPKFKGLGEMLAHFGCLAEDAASPPPASPAEVSDAEIACFFGVRADILQFYAANRWDTSPAKYRAILEDWWAWTTERPARLRCGDADHR